MPTTVLRDNGLSALIAGELELLAQGFQFTEGPLELGDGSLLFQDIKAERTYLLPAGTKRGEGPPRADRRRQRPDVRPRRLDLLLRAERPPRLADEARRLGRRDRRRGIRRHAAEQPQRHRRPLQRPSLLHRPALRRPARPPLHFQGVYSLDPETNNLELLLKDFEKPNGLAFSPDESILYVCDTAKYHVRAFSVEPSGFVDPATGRVFATQDPETQGGPDGMKVDTDGRVYVAVAQGVWVYEPDGRLLGIIPTPARPSNLAWRGQDGATLAITAVDKVHQIRLKTSGVLPRLRPEASA